MIDSYDLTTRRGIVVARTGRKFVMYTEDYVGAKCCCLYIDYEVMPVVQHINTFSIEMPRP